MKFKLLPIPLEYRIMLLMEENGKMTFNEIMLELADLEDVIEDDVKSCLVQMEWESTIYEIFPGEYSTTYPDEEDELEELLSELDDLEEVESVT